MTQTLDEYFMGVYEMATDELDKSERKFKEYPQSAENIVFHMESHRNAVGIIDFCYKKDFVHGKKNFYGATLCREWFYEEFSKGRYEVSTIKVTTYAYESLYNAILCGNRQRAIHMAELFGKYSELEEKDLLALKLPGYSLKYVILDDVKKANEWLDKLEQVKDKRGMKQLFNGHGRAMRGLINRDETEFNTGLLTMLKNHVGRMKKQGKDLEQYFAYDSVALAMIARDRGIQVTVEHNLLPEEYFVEANINYDEITMF